MNLLEVIVEYLRLRKQNGKEDADRFLSDVLVDERFIPHIQAVADQSDSQALLCPHCGKHILVADLSTCVEVSLPQRLV